MDTNIKIVKFILKEKVFPSLPYPIVHSPSPGGQGYASSMLFNSFPSNFIQVMVNNDQCNIIDTCLRDNKFTCIQFRDTTNITYTIMKNIIAYVTWMDNVTYPGEDGEINPGSES